MLAALAAAANARWPHKVTAWTAAVVLVGLVGLSRLYLGANWLTDVLGGGALGAAWLFALLTTTRTVHALHAGTSPDQRPPPPDPRASRQQIPGQGAALGNPARPVRRHPEGG
jgi:membrane-associated phospholipid phosphatase